MAMDRNELTMAVAGTLVGAFLLGWIFRWIYGRMNVHGPHGASHGDMASELHAAEEARHRAELRLTEVEAAAARRVAKLDAELALTREAFAGAQAQAEEVRTAYRRAMGGAESGSLPEG
jgi:sigma54-dependent transcription regulator